MAVTLFGLIRSQGRDGVMHERRFPFTKAIALMRVMIEQVGPEDLTTLEIRVEAEERFTDDEGADVVRSTLP